MDRKILFSIAAMGIVMALAGAGAIAQFSDTESSEGNTFTAGTLNLKYKVDTDGDGDFTDEDWQDGDSAHVTIEDVKPGDSGNIEIPFIVEGTTKGYVDVRIANVTSDEMGRNEPELEVDGTAGDGSGELGKKLELGFLRIDGVYSGGGPFEDYADSWWFKDLKIGILGADGFTFGKPYPRTSNVEIQWELPSEVGNVVQSDTLTFDVEFSLNQGSTGLIH